MKTYYKLPFPISLKREIIVPDYNNGWKATRKKTITQKAHHITIYYNYTFYADQLEIEDESGCTIQSKYIKEKYMRVFELWKSGKLEQIKDTF